MARIRTVKPELFRHVSLFKAETQTQLPLRLAFIGLFTRCDREGRFKWVPEDLKCDVLPYDKEIDFEAVLDALVNFGFIVKYQLNGKTYGCIPSWLEHQTINTREQQSRIPIPLENNELDESDVDDTVMHVHAHGEGKGREGKGKDICSEKISEPQQDKIIIKIPLDDKTDFEITDLLISDWKTAYPLVDVEQELRNCRAWNEANPLRRKTRRGILRHINGWLAKAQKDKASNVYAFPKQQPPSPITDWDKVARENAEKTNRTVKRASIESAMQFRDLVKSKVRL
jgi:hypothetical protein